MSDFISEYGMLIVSGLLAIMIVAVGLLMWNSLGHYAEQCSNLLAGGVSY